MSVSAPEPESTAESERDGCDACGERAAKLLRCSRCRASYYCGAACQRQAFDEHRRECDAARRRTCAPAAWMWPAAVRFAASADGVDAHWLLALPGRGDSPAALAALARHFALPQTAVLVLEPPHRRAWAPESAVNAVDADGDVLALERAEAAGVAASVVRVRRLLRVLERRRRATRSRVLLFGYAQGAQVVAQLAAEPTEAPLAAAVAISDSCNAALLDSLGKEAAATEADNNSNSTKFRPTPLFVTHRRSHADFAHFERKAARLRRHYETAGHASDFQFLAVDKDRDELHGPVEARNMFEFIAPRMTQRQVALEEAAERGEVIRIK